METRAVLILAGLADPCRNIGTECRYDLLPVPWNKEALKSCITHLLKAEQWMITTEELSTSSLIGLRCWVCPLPESQPLQLLMTYGWSESQGAKAAMLIDELSQNVPAAEFVWPSNDLTDERAIDGLQNILFQIAKCRLNQSDIFFST